MMWSEDEDRKLLELYGKSSNGERRSSVDISKELGRSPTSVTHRVMRLRNGVTLTKRRWTAAEDAVIEEKLRQGLSETEISKCIPGRSPGAIGYRTLRLSTQGTVSKVGDFTDAQIQHMIKMVLEEGRSVVEAAAELGCSYVLAYRLWATRCTKLLSKEELTSIRHRHRWTPAESEHLTKIYTQTEIRVVDAALHFPSKSRRAVDTQIQALYLKSARSQRQAKRRDQAHDTKPVIGQKSGQMESSSQQKRSYSSFSCCFSKTRKTSEQRRAFSSSRCSQKYEYWSAAEDQEIRKLVQQGWSSPDICKQLGRSLAAVRSRRQSLKVEILISNNRTPWSIEEDATILEKQQQGLSISEMSTYLPRRSYYAIMIRLNTLRRLTPLELRRARALPRALVTGADVQRILKMSIHEHKTKYEIAAELGRSIGSVRRIWYKECIPLLSEEQKKTI